MNVRRQPGRLLVWMLTLAVASSITMATGPARAACLPDPPTDNDVVTCDGTHPNGYDASGAVDLLINVKTGAVVEDYIKGLTSSVLTIEAAGTVSGNTPEATVQGTNAVSITNLGDVEHLGGGTAVQLIGDDNVVLNERSIQAFGDGAVGVFVEGDRNIVLNFGLILGSGDGTTGIRIGDTIFTTRIINAADGIIEGAEYSIHSLGGTANISNFGEINGNISLAGGSDTLHNEEGASIDGDVDLGDGDNELRNSGWIAGTVIGGDGGDNVTNLAEGYIKAVALGGGGDELINSGTIESVHIGGVGQNWLTNLEGASITSVTLGDSDDGTNIVINLGTISGPVNGGTAVDWIANVGGIFGEIDLGDGDDSVANAGSIQNNISMGTGMDVLENQAGGLIVGDVDMGDDDDTIYNHGAIEGEIDTGAGDDTINNYSTTDGDIHMGTGNDTINNTGTIDGNIDTGADDDVVTNQGAIHGNVDMGDGGDTLVNEAWAIINGQIIDMGAGSDTLTNKERGTINSHVDMGDGNDALTNEEWALLNGNVDMGAGNDVLDNRGTIAGTVRLGDGNAADPDLGIYTLHNTGTIDNGVVGGTGDDAIHNESVMGSAAVIRGGIQLIAGTNTVQNSGEIYGGVTGGTGDDYIVNSNAIHGNVDLGDAVEKNVLENSGTIHGSVIGGEARDEVYNTSSLTIDGDVNLGAGDDLLQNTGVITGGVRTGAGSDVVTNEDGGDIRTGIVLGSGTNTVTNEGTIRQGITGTDDGEDTITNAERGTIDGTVNLGDGSNFLANSGLISGDYLGGGGVDSITNHAGSLITSGVDLGDGLNFLSNQGQIGGSISGGSDEDTIHNEDGGRIGGGVDLGGGLNSLVNRGEIGGTVQGTGENVVENFGQILQSYVGGNAKDQVWNAGLIGGSVHLGNGSNTLWNHGQVVGGVLGGTGSDYVENTGTIGSMVNLGDGDDTVLVGPNGLVTGDVILGDGVDRLILQGWDGNHRITGVRDGGDGNEDQLILDGGAGTLLTGDFLNFENVTVWNAGDWTISGPIPSSGGVATSSSLSALWLQGDQNKVTYASGSTISVNADSGTGVLITGTDNVLTMDGDVDVTGELAAGIRVEGIGNTVTNNSSESIVVSGIDSVGVTITGDSNEYGNVGTVRFTGLRSVGVRINAGSGNTVTNHGTGAIIGEGNDTIGVVLGGSDNTLTNIGAITVTGANSVGTLAVGADNTVVNDSSITASGNFSVGAILQGTGHLLDNRSLIGAAGNSARGVIVNGLVGDDNVITNTGTIRAELANSVGVQTTGDGVMRLTNHGVVEARQHTGIPGVYNYFHSIVGGDGSEIVTNYGTLRGTVNLGGGDDELMLMAGSQLEHGHILMGDGNDTLVYSTLADDIGPTYAISGGDGDDVLRLTDDGVAHLYEVVDFETLELKDAGTWVFHRSVAFDNHIVIDDGDAGHLKLMGVQFDTGGLTVGKAATLSGTGTITGDVTVKGVIRPGHSHGTLNIDGDYNQADDSTYELELATNGTSDLIHAKGAATIGDNTTLKITAEYGYYDPTHRFSIIEADGGVTGEFDNVAWDINLLFLAPEATTDGQHVYVDLVHAGPNFASVAETTNHTAIAQALDQAASLGEGAGVINLVLPALDEDDARQAYDSLSGEIYTQHRAASLSSMRAFTRSAADTIDSLSDGQRIWAAAYGGSSDVRQQGDFPGAELRYKGFVAGWAPRSTGNWTLGLMAGMGDINVNMTDRASTGAAESRRFGVYAHFGNDGTGFTAQFASGSDTFNVERQLALLGHPHDDRLATGKYRSNSTAFTLEGSVTYATGKYDIKPTFGLGWYSLTRPAFTETGAGAANLSLMDDEYSVTQGTIGITISQTSDEGRLDVPELRLGFVANSGQFESAFAAAFPDAPGAPFTIKGASPGDSAFVIGATLRGGEGRVRYELAYDAEFWRSSTQQTVHGKVSFSF